ncbi:hypothetical protein [Streptomyces sp. NPDC005322]|uniref:hypothetical protein n=1 Tax=unclassified Streptomyces TaxID=2593676 RepID=UPI0033ACB9F1
MTDPAERSDRTDPILPTDPFDARGPGRPEDAPGPDRNGHRRHGLEKHEVPPMPDAIPATRSSELSGPAESTEQRERTRTPDGPSFPVLPTSEHDKLTQRLRHAVSGFVDSPRGSVEEADIILDEITTRLTDLLSERRRTLRAAWHDDATAASETEELRLAMRGYRNVLERLLSI